MGGIERGEYDVWRMMHDGMTMHFYGHWEGIGRLIDMDIGMEKLMLIDPFVHTVSCFGAFPESAGDSILVLELANGMRGEGLLHSLSYCVLYILKFGQNMTKAGIEEDEMWPEFSTIICDQYYNSRRIIHNFIIDVDVQRGIQTITFDTVLSG